MSTRLAPFFACLCLALAPALAAAPASAQAGDPFARFEAHDADSGTRIDYNAWSEILQGVVFDVGISDRRIGRGRTVQTATRIDDGNRSRYRNEANRVVYHLLNDQQKAAIGAYRAELEALPQQVRLSRLSRDEQLAYWINLHNVVIIDEIAQQYPHRYVDRLRPRGADGFLHDADIITVDGVAMSPNDIRFNIVARYWDDPRVMYGFFSGAVGGPSLRDEAFTGRNVWALLDRAAREYVNALRGVETDENPARISPMYGEWRDALFPRWPEDLRSHLSSYAYDEVRSIVRDAEEFNFLRYDWAIADLTNGTGKCGRTSGFAVRSVGGEVRDGLDGTCGVLPPHALELVIEVRERRLRLFGEGRIGEVRVRDIPTDDQGNIIVDDVEGQEIIRWRGSNRTGGAQRQQDGETAPREDEAGGEEDGR